MNPYTKPATCQRCGYELTTAVIKRHENRCGKFSPMDKFIDGWLNDPRQIQTSERYNVPPQAVAAQVKFLASRGVKLPKATIPRTLRKKPKPRPQYEKTQGTKCLQSAGGCGMLNHGNYPCLFCKQDAEGNPNNTIRVIVEALPQ